MVYSCADDILEGSICWKCVNRVRRVISTEGLEIYDEDNNSLDPEDMPIIEHEFCSLLHTELDVIVLECSGFKSGEGGADDFFKHKDILNR